MQVLRTHKDQKKKNQRRDSNKAKQEEMTPEKNKHFVEKTRNTEDGVLSFRGEGCNIPLLCPGIFCNLAYYCTCLGEELKAKAPPRQHLVAFKKLTI